jgi:acyl carrier protein
VSPEQLVPDVIATLLDLEADRLSGDTPLAAIDGWDSVNALRVLVYLERRLDRSLEFERFSDAKTVADLVAVVGTATVGPGGTP